VVRGAFLCVLIFIVFFCFQLIPVIPAVPVFPILKDILLLRIVNLYHILIYINNLRNISKKVLESLGREKEKKRHFYWRRGNRRFLS